MVKRKSTTPARPSAPALGHAETYVKAQGYSQPTWAGEVVHPRWGPGQLFVVLSSKGREVDVLVTRTGQSVHLCGLTLDLTANRDPQIMFNARPAQENPVVDLERKYSVDTPAQAIKFLERSTLPDEYVDYEPRSRLGRKPRKVRSNGKDTPKRKQIQLILSQLNGRCQVCRDRPVSAEHVFRSPDRGTKASSLAAVCTACLPSWSGAAAIDTIHKETQPPETHTRRPVTRFCVDAKLETDRARATRAERLQWAGWTHLQRRIKERVLPLASQRQIQDVIEQITHIIGSALPERVDVDSRGLTLLDLGVYGGIALSWHDGILAWTTWFPATSAWRFRASTESWIQPVQQQVLPILDSVSNATKARVNSIPSLDVGGSWPVRDRAQAKTALQFMTRGFGHVRKYPQYLLRLSEIYPPEQAENRDIWAMYQRNRHKIGEKCGCLLPSLGHERKT